MTMVSNPASQYLNPDCPAATSVAAPGESPLEMLAATCSKIGMPDSAKNGKTRPAGGLAMALVKGDESTKGLSPNRSASAASGEPSVHRPPAAGGSADDVAGRAKDRPHSSTGATSSSSAAAMNAAAAAAIASAQALSSNPLHQSPLNAFAAAMRAGNPLVPPPPPPAVSSAAAAAAAVAALPYSGYSAALASLAAASSQSPYASLYGAPAGRPCVDPSCKAACAAPGPMGRPCPLGCVGCATPLPTTSATDFSSLLAAAYNPFLAHVFTSSAGPAPFVPPPPAASSSDADGDANVCNWVSADGPCHKRFDTPEELMKHLLTHTAKSTGNGNSHSTAAADRYHPYKRIGAPTSVSSASSSQPPAPSTGGLLTVPSMPFMPTAGGPGALSALPGTGPHAAATAAAAAAHLYAAMLYGARPPM